MASGILVNIKNEVTCPICLELLTKPLSLRCGHSFCQVCIKTHDKESRIGQGGESSCPVCRTPYQPGKLRRNWPMANIAERFREVKLNLEEEQKGDLCVRHGEKLLFFCKEDGKVLCWLCERAKEHRGHHTFLMEDVAQEYQEKLQAALERLKNEQQEAEKLEADVREERTSWKNQIRCDTQRIQAEFYQMRSILNSEEQKELHKLKNEEGDILRNLAKAEKKLVRQSQLVRALISDVEHRLQGSTMKMLQDVNGILERSETLTLKKPKTFPVEQRRVSRASDLIGKLQVFKVDVMLNPVKSCSNVIISADKRKVMLRRVLEVFNMNPCNFSTFDILGHQCFSSGKYYWEVDVSRKIAWIMGVYSEISSFDISRISVFIFGHSENYPNIYSKYGPQNGYWVIGLQNESEYSAFEDSSTCDPQIVTLSMAVPPCRVGVFLDYEAGTVSFFNVTNHGSLIYKFSKCRFSRTVYPYFNPWNCPTAMTLCPPSS
ncbi:E3 ubiquitin-protein ligase TRIM22-like isoform X2 [Diceros bicornis minor]|uniref:E3 ubiquitin-protein ligase TRIM22-like isoform X2 n=1 Tax=Diceros bicornis minor TaxID=77932 RepID=UPI0026F1BF6D|nr:E3 ubiquitin-protein ligase TRIM22-like isoform X2 [Diceros bicornis minor]